MPHDDPQLQLAHEWLERAEQDLRLARLALPDGSVAGLVAFHCQQAADKALKAFLAWQNQPLPKIHDLPALLVRCAAFDSALLQLQQAADTLDVYLTAGRYPDAGPLPSVSEANEALRLAEEVVRSVTALLP